jgi:hypothetical protein
MVGRQWSDAVAKQATMPASLTFKVLGYSGCVFVRLRSRTMQSGSGTGEGLSLVLEYSPERSGSGTAVASASLVCIESPRA